MCVNVCMNAAQEQIVSSPKYVTAWENCMDGFWITSPIITTNSYAASTPIVLESSIHGT